MTDDKEIFSFDEIIDDFKDLHAATDEMGILINNFMWGGYQCLECSTYQPPKKTQANPAAPPLHPPMPSEAQGNARCESFVET